MSSFSPFIPDRGLYLELYEMHFLALILFEVPTVFLPGVEEGDLA